MKILLTSYKLYDAIISAVPTDIASWLIDHEKRWKVQVKFELPDDDTERLNGLAVGLDALANDADTSEKRAAALNKIVAQIREVVPPDKDELLNKELSEGYAVPDLSELEPEPEPKEKTPAPVVEPVAAMVTHTNLGKLTVDTGTKPVVEIPPLELRARNLLGNLFRDIKRGE